VINIKRISLILGAFDIVASVVGITLAVTTSGGHSPAYNAGYQVGQVARHDGTFQPITLMAGGGTTRGDSLPRTVRI
jgi:hypothetical protein